MMHLIALFGTVYVGIGFLAIVCYPIARMIFGKNVEPGVATLVATMWAFAKFILIAPIMFGVFMLFYFIWWAYNDVTGQSGFIGVGIAFGFFGFLFWISAQSPNNKHKTQEEVLEELAEKMVNEMPKSENGEKTKILRHVGFGMADAANRINDCAYKHDMAPLDKMPTAQQIAVMVHVQDKIKGVYCEPTRRF